MLETRGETDIARISAIRGYPGKIPDFDYPLSGAIIRRIFRIVKKIVNMTKFDQNLFQKHFKHKKQSKNSQNTTQTVLKWDRDLEPILVGDSFAVYSFNKLNIHA